MSLDGEFLPEYESDGDSIAIDIYSSDFFEVDPAELEAYGAFDISLINDLPLFIDPFLLFNSNNVGYRELCPAQ